MSASPRRAPAPAPPPAPTAAPARAALGTAAALAAAAFGLYVLTAAPGLALVDSAELALTAVTGGVPHPPGVPLYRLLGGIFAKLPLGSPERAMNLMSAFFAALAVGAVFFAAERMLVLRNAGAPPRARLLAAATAAGIFATSFNPWTWSALAEVYSLNVFLAAAAWACAWAALVPGASAAPAMGALFLASFGMAVHHATSALTFPVLLLMAALGRPALLRSRAILGTLAFSLALSLSLYLTLIPAARHDPGLGWGGATTLPLLWRHMTGTQYAEQVGAPLAESLRVIREMASTLFLGAGIPAALLAVAGLAAGIAARTARRIVLAPLAIIALNVLLSARYIAGPEDRMAYDLPATVAWCLLAALGAHAMLARTRLPAVAAAAVVMAVPVAWNAVRNYPLCNLRGERTASLFAEEMLGDLPPGSVFLTSEWNLAAPYLYRRHVDGWRTDLDVIDVLMLRRFWYLDYLEREHPALIAASRSEFDRFRDQIRRFDLGRSYDQQNIQAYYDALMLAWVDAGRARGGAYVDWSTPSLPQEASWVRQRLTRPEGMRLRFFLPGDPGVDAPPAPPGPCDAANLRHVRSRITAESLDGDRSTLVPRFDPYWKVWSQYDAAVTSSLLVAANGGPEAFEARRRELAAWFPEPDAAARRALGAAR